MESLIQILVRRDGYTELEAKEEIAACRKAMLAVIEDGDFIYAEEIFEDWFRLEPDYMDEVLFG